MQSRSHKIAITPLGQLEYHIFNSKANRPILCFHGYGQEASEYAWLAKEAPEYKIIAINLFYHGNSRLTKPYTISYTQLKIFIDLLLAQENITTFEVTGFSMGGRFALATTYLYAERINALYLVAPDGLVEGPWYKLATQTKIMRLIFKAVLHSYPVFVSLTKILAKIGILNKGLLKFASLYMQIPKERHRIFNTWTGFRNLTLAPQHLAKLIAEYNIHCTIILGKYDRVIPVKRLVTNKTKVAGAHYNVKPITHHKLFYFNFLKAPSKSN